ncbi:NAD(P)H-quinone oxidoreductase [Pullulanibacillus sp. KACC 23026]|uniref:NAD(P)H-quinone oxidoreductase n=1 Tax=Pullulanibacillus sp. KACC 23026 TaxID=3028315 RepID=UPI0023AFBAFE|nr:NAD(P)H-quinone oxidoreductase [Pullulanibacillus sp. KACC 23026]WEG14348.1 NAD(P)H-quinone oxidoreductase [Pullulanibacillus sp. KACC 23026]
MKAVLVKQPGGREALYIGEVETPSPKANELLVKIKATALNRADIAQRQGHYPPPEGASPILGLEMAGVVEQVGAQVTKWKPGDRVFGLLEGGGYAEYATLSEHMAMPLPENLSYEEAAAIPEVFLTAYQTLFWIGQLKKGERVLVHAGASGVGTAAIQLAKERGARVAITAGSEEKCKACRELGADLAINYKTSSFLEEIKQTFGQVDVILDFVGAPYFEDNLKALAVDGRLVIISTLGGAKLSETNLAYLMMKRLSVTGTTLRARRLSYKEALTRDFQEDMLPKFSSSALKPIIDRVFDWKDVQSAHKVMEDNQNIGKLILKVSN